MSKPKYHGWIYIQKTEGRNDCFYVAVKKETLDEFVAKNPELGKGQKNWLYDPDQRFMGYGAKGAQAAVDFFEDALKLGSVKLLPTPLGHRVYTEEEENEGR